MQYIVLKKALFFKLFINVQKNRVLQVNTKHQTELDLIIKLSYL